MRNKIIAYTCLKVLVFLLLIILEIFSATLAFETIGEIYSSIYFIVVVFNIIPIFLLVLGKNKQLATLLMSLIALAVVPYQVYLGQRLLSLKEEAANITVYLYDYKVNNQDFPADLSMYEYKEPQLKKFFSYNKEEAGKFLLQYYVGSANTSHYLRSDIKRWHYYPD